jgi:RND family efflux transporter MFP subunit
MARGLKKNKNNMSTLLKKPWFYLTAFTALGFVAGAYFFLFTEPNVSYETAIVQRTDLVEEVDLTGQVKPTEEVNLSFQATGRISAAPVLVGDSVEPGDLLASIGTAELNAQLASSRANAASAQSVLTEYERALAAEESRLAELKLGTRPEEIAVSQTKVDNAKRALSDAESSLVVALAKADQDLAVLYSQIPDILTAAYTRVDDAVHQHADTMFSKQFANKDELTFVVNDPVLKNQVEAARNDAQVAIDRFAGLLISLPSSETGLDAAIRDALQQIKTVQSFLLLLNTALNNTVSLDADTLASYKTSVSTARSAANTSVTECNNQIQAIASHRVNTEQTISAVNNTINDAKNLLFLAESELNLKQAGALPEQIRAQESRVEQAKSVLISQQSRVNQALAEVQRVNAQFADFSILAPIKGIVTKQDAKVGEIVALEKNLITIISVAAYEIEANVPEADIAKLSVGDKASLTLDAYDDDLLFDAQVLRIDPAQTLVEGVTTYKATFQFMQEDERVKSGMTANLTVTTDRRDGVLAVPQRAIISSNGSKRVQVISNGTLRDVEVKTGLVSQDGLVEILSGLGEGEEVVVSIRK